ncbi:MAG TPA: prenyltransferase [Anaerolineaceae bacterium]|nr:prenyltransferase [Anaerolineaceae bacterium]
MWVKALRVIPRINKEEWDRLDVISRWLISTRAAVLIMTFISAAIAGLLAARAGMFDLGKWALLVIGLVFAHATNNLLNDLTDYRRGVDRDNYFRTQYGPQPLEAGLMSQRTLLTYAAITGLIAAAAGIALVVQSGPLAWGLMLAGAVFVLFYTWPLKYIGLGELTVLLVWGPLMIAGGYYVITGQWDWNVVIASLPYGLGPTTVFFGKHIDKFKEDKAKGIHTLPVIIGEKTARVTVSAMMVLMYISVIYLVAIGYFHWVMLVVLLSAQALLPVLKIYQSPKPDRAPDGPLGAGWPLWFVSAAFIHNRRFGLLFLVGLIADLLIRMI